MKPRFFTQRYRFTSEIVFKIKKLFTSSRINKACRLYKYFRFLSFFPSKPLFGNNAISPYVLHKDVPSTRDKQLLPKNITSASTPIVITQQAGIILSQKLARKKEGEWHHQLSACKSSS